ncbi:hypothetical protein BMJ20_09210 [Sinorhizobium medicae]|nr:hypothetical protein BMJ20_09210 [Sinorhizobium medicae]
MHSAIENRAFVEGNKQNLHSAIETRAFVEGAVFVFMGLHQPGAADGGNDAIRTADIALGVRGS